MKTVCPNCNEEVEMKIVEYFDEEGCFLRDEANVPVIASCPKCNHRFDGELHYSTPELRDLQSSFFDGDDDYE